MIKTYSVFKDVLGNEIELELKEPLTVRELLRILEERYTLPRDLEKLVIVDDKVVDENYVIDRDTTVHVAPPFSGGGRLVDVKILDEDSEVDFNQLLKGLMNSGAGALSVFVGFVKKYVEDHEVYELEYSAVNSVALKQLERIA
ncbi:MAG: molybdenum cofactor biosynthesis protein MoaE, partial [Desulfurococcaceae archaeon]